MQHYIELLSMTDEYSIGNNNNLKKIFVNGDVDISGNIAMSGNINCNEINSTSITATTFYGDGSQLTGIITSGGSANLNDHSDASFGNVDVSGNLKVDGLLDMSNNIIMNNNRILFTASDSSIIPPDSGIITRVQDISNTLTNVISDVSNLLTSNNDASFNNVDISGNLTLKGSLGVLDTSTNDISYGAVGSVLTSNGFGNSLSWKEPVYYSAHLTSDITYNSDIYAEPQNVVNLTLVTESHPNSFDTITGIFTAPRDGIYYVDYGVLASDDADPKEMYVLVSRIDFRTNNSGTFTQHTGNHVLGGGSSTIQSNVSSILQLNKGNQIRCVFQMTYNTGSNTAYRIKLIANYYHPSNSDRHSLRATRQSVFAIF
jgi:hypothetical protein